MDISGRYNDFSYREIGVIIVDRDMYPGFSTFRNIPVVISDTEGAIFVLRKRAWGVVVFQTTQFIRRASVQGGISYSYYYRTVFDVMNTISQNGIKIVSS